MNELGSEYGKALFLFAEENGTVEEFDKALGTVKEVLGENEDYLSFLSSPHIPSKERCAALSAAFGGEIPRGVLNFLMLLCEKGRLSHLNKAVEEYRRLFFLKENYKKAKITSAKALTDEEKEKLLEKLEKVIGGKIEAEYIIDPEILGGIKVESEGKIFDGSIQNRLREAKEVITR
ncbi:MAG: ATP synthase F1 subunit delta [Clostridia bacterium]|nr:ATP synthase F1 subunit delta [Clostridia bacterium]